ncbi:hypothetical protein [Vibrio sp. D431a]|uniref:hypothetical protein n=1 Tax=Vibrio sp. D431a TaxID=2837388 RepID=UPI002552577F|nr:hypothetical protein [Vibrio sp. D431a]MDK9789765.1 hypothetical protein [Vibrio sp. D431a]
MKNKASTLSDKAVEQIKDLHSDLIPYVSEDGPLGLMLHHPLIIEVFLCAPFVPHINKSYEKRAEFLEIAIAESDYASIIELHERPYRFEGYLQHVLWAADKAEAAKHLHTVWIDSELPHVNLDSWLKCFDYLREENELLSSVAELEFPLTVYRGVAAESEKQALKYGHNLAWTTDHNEAVKFAERMTNQRDGLSPFILKTILNSVDEVYMFSNLRKESEVVVNPQRLKKILVV